MWEAIQYVSSAVGLVAFAAAVAYMAYRTRLSREQRLIQTAPPDQRVVMAERVLKDFHVDTSNLTKEQQFTLAIQQLDHRKASSKRNAIVVVIISFIAAIVLIVALVKDWRGGGPSPSPERSLLKISVPEVIPQRVNFSWRHKSKEGPSRNEERATFGFIVHNPTARPMTIEKAEVVPDSVSQEPVAVSTALFIPAIDHVGHISVWLDNPKKGQAVSVPLSLTIASGDSKPFVLWFKSNMDDGVGYLDVVGKLRLITPVGAEDSSPFTVSVAHDSKSMHYKD